MATDWTEGLNTRQREAVAREAWEASLVLCPCLCGADSVEASTHTHLPGMATCPANLRSGVANAFCVALAPQFSGPELEGGP